MLASDKGPKSLLDLTFLYSIGNLATRILSVLLVFVTTFYLSEEEVGQYDLILISLSLATPFLTLQLTDSALRWLLENNSKDHKQKVFSNIAIVVMLSSIITGTICLVVSCFLEIKYLWLSYSLLVCQVFFLFFQQCLRGFGENRLYVSSSIVYTLIYVSFAGISLSLLNLKLDGLIYANILAAIILITILLFYKVKLYKYFSLSSLDKIFLRNLLYYSIPLLPNSVSWWAISSANRYIISFFIGATANGIFAIANKLPTMLLMLTNIFYLAWQEKAILSFNNENRDAYYSKILNWYIRVLFSTSILVVAFNKIVFKYLVNDKFYEASNYTSLLLLGGIFSSLAGFYGTGFLSTKNTKNIFVSSLIGGIVTVVVSFLMVPFFGLFGISFGVVLGYLILFLVRIKQTCHIFNITFPNFIFIKLMGLFAFASILGASENHDIHYFNIAFSIIMIIIINYDVIKTAVYPMLRMIRKV